MIPVIRLRRMRRAGHVARLGERRDVYRGLVRKKLREREHLEDPGVDWRIILKIGLQEVGQGRMDWMYQAQGRDGGHLRMR
jgi:hypothetical protein